MLYQFKRVSYKQLDKTEKVAKGSVVMTKEDHHLLIDYILYLEASIWASNKTKTFGTIREEMEKFLGEEKCNRFYGEAGKTK